MSDPGSTAKRVRKPIAKAPVADADICPPETVQVPTAPKPTREELLAKLRSKRNQHRNQLMVKGMNNAASKMTKKMVSKLVTGNLGEKDLKFMADLEETYNQCEGNIAEVCRRKGIPADLIPDIQSILESVKETGVNHASADKLVRSVMAKVQSRYL